MAGYAVTVTHHFVMASRLPAGIQAVVENTPLVLFMHYGMHEMKM
jgi:hypothetical protein